MSSKLPIPVRNRIAEYNARQCGEKKPRSTKHKGVVYIAGKVGDLSDDTYYYEVLSKFAKRERELRKLGYLVVNPMRLNPRNTKWHVAMKKCIAKLAVSDFISPLPDWINSPGATIELWLANLFKMPKIYPSKANYKYNKKVGSWRK